MRVVILGPGGAGKSSFARELHARTGADLVEIDTVFWQPGLVALPAAEWAARQEELFAGGHWIADGDLGPYDVLDVRLQRADAVVLLDLPLVTCVWRSLRRSRQRRDYWTWLLTWRRRYRPALLAAVAAQPGARLMVARSTADCARVMAALTRPA